MEPIKLFNRWDMDGLKVNDPGLSRYINIKPIVIPRTAGRLTHASIDRPKIPVVERFINHLMVPGHRGKKHKYSSGNGPASARAIMAAVYEAFALIEERTKKNPIEVMVRALENSALLEEIAAYRMGGVMARQAVVISPQRRLDLALRNITQGIYQSNFAKKHTLAEAIANELIAGAANDGQKSIGVRERQRVEKEAEGSR